MQSGWEHEAHIASKRSWKQKLKNLSGRKSGSVLKCVTALPFLNPAIQVQGRLENNLQKDTCKAGRMAQMLQRLPGKQETRSPEFKTTAQKKKKKIYIYIYIYTYIYT
jgi:hypothetical protein